MATTAEPGRASAARAVWIIAGLAVALLLVCVLRLSVGSSSFGWPDEGFMLERVVRLRAGLIVGVALAVSGVCLQALLRNELAEPSTTGLSSGAGVGVMIQLTLLYHSGAVLGPQYLGAIFGAFLTMAIVFLAARRKGMIDPLGLLLTGVVLATINGAIMMLGRSVMGQRGFAETLTRWGMGYINENVSAQITAAVGVVTLVGCVLAVLSARAMDVASFSDAEAESLGVNLKALRTQLFVVPAVLTAGSVVLAGPIAFVGLICPHLARLMLGPSHRPVLIASAIMGAILIIAADAASAALFLAFDIGLVPIGVFTALIGGPAFLWMLRPQLGRGME